MSIHYCMTYPCPVCSTSAFTVSTPTWGGTPYVPMSINSPVTSTYQATQQFFTWREALLTALRSRSTQKPRVSRDYDGMWLVTTYPAMYAINTAS